VIPAIPSIGSAISAGASQASTAASGASAAATTEAPSTTGATGTSFSDVLGNAIDSLDSSQQAATNLSLQAASGNASIADVTVASTDADLETQLVTAVRDKAVDAFNSIMDMTA
jgi:flagellar hook-basal body complex protein FliE